MESLISQPEIDEIFLVEDGSEDSSLQVCLNLANKYPSIKVLQHPGGINKGAPESRNLGLRSAKNEWIQFMDADDELLPGKIKDQVKLIRGKEDLIVGMFYYIHQNGTTSLTKPMQDPWSGLIATRLGYTSSNLWRKDSVIQAGGWEPSLINIQEYNLIFSMLKLGAIIKYSEKALTKIYFQEDSIGNSSQNESEKRDHYFSFREKVKSYLISNDQYTLRRRHHFNCASGLMLKYHQPDFEIKYDKTYFLLYFGLRSLKNNYRSFLIGITGGILILFLLKAILG